MRNSEFRTSLFALCACLLFGCCTSDKDIGMAADLKALDIRSASVTCTTRGVYDSGGTLGSGSIGVYAIGTGYTSANVQYNYGNSAWAVQTAGQTIYLSANAATLFAYGPYSSTFNRTSQTLTAAPYDETKDLCTATVSGKSNTAATVSFTLAHAYARLSFVINKDNSYSGTCAVGDISISGPAIYTTAVEDFSTSTLSGKTVGKVEFNPAISSMTIGTPITQSLLLIPASTGEFTSATTVKFTVDDVVLTATIPVAAPSASSDSGINELKSGTNYTVNVCIKGTQLSVGSVQIKSWNSVTDPIDLFF